MEARVSFTGLNLGGEIRFVVDTGADRTLIGSYDSGWTTDTTGPAVPPVLGVAAEESTRMGSSLELRHQQLRVKAPPGRSGRFTYRGDT